MKAGTLGLRVRVALLAAAALLPLMALLVFFMQQQVVEVRHQTHARLDHLAARVAERLNGAVAAAGTLAESLARSPDLGSSRWARLESEFRRLARPGTAYHNAGLVARDGEVLISAVPLPAKVWVADRDYFREVMVTGTVAVGEFTLGRVTGQPTLVVAAPVKGPAGSPLQVVFLALDLDLLSRVIEETDAPDGLVLTLLDRRGRLVVRHPRGAWQPGQDATRASLFRSVVQNDAGPVVGTGLEGDSRVASWAPVMGTPPRVLGYAVVAADQRVLLGQSVDIYRRGVMAAVAASLVAVLLAVLGGDVLLRRPLCRVTDSAARAEESGWSGGVLGALAGAVDGLISRLRLTSQRYRTVLESTEEAILGLDAEGRIALANGAASQILRLDAADLAGRRLHDVVHPGGDHGAKECPLSAALEKGRPLSRLVDEFQRPDGSGVPVEWSAAPVREPDRDLAMLIRFADISPRLELERQVQHALKMQALGRLAASVAHDFNNVLTVLQGNSELLLQGDIERGTVEEIARACRRGKGLTQRLLAMSRARTDRSREVVDLAELVGDFTRILQRLLGEDVAVRYQPPPGPLFVNLDVSQFEHWLLNLAANARDAMPSGGSLLLDVRPDPDGAALLTVEDTGEGMDPEVLEHACDPFFTTKPEGRGTGLGLASLRVQVQEHGGTLRIESEKGRGTRIALGLPLAAGGAPPAPEPEVQRPAGGERILVIDDDDSVRKLVVAALRRTGYQVAEARNPEEVLGDDRNGRPVDLLLTDLVMPGLSGLELWRALQERRNPPRRVLFMSGHSGERLEGDWLEKPFTLAQLLAAVRSRLDD